MRNSGAYAIAITIDYHAIDRLGVGVGGGDISITVGSLRVGRIIRQPTLLKPNRGEGVSVTGSC